MLKLSRCLVAAIAGAAALSAALPARAAVDLIVNGNFEQTTLTSSTQFTTQVTGWNNPASTTAYSGYGYNFLIMNGTADTTGFTSIANNSDKLWGPGNGVGSANYSNNGLTSYSPTGGNYILADGGAGFRGAITQTLSNLTIGTNYQLSFYWAAAQFAGFNGATTEGWQVSFGSAAGTTTQSTPTVTTSEHGFTPWVQQTMLFTATATTQTLSFLAVGTPNGSPPSSLLDGVSLYAVPEPGTAGIVAIALVGITALTRKRRSAKRATPAA